MEVSSLNLKFIVVACVENYWDVNWLAKWPIDGCRGHFEVRMRRVDNMYPVN